MEIVCLILNKQKPCQMNFQSGHTIYIPTNGVWEIQFLWILTSIWYYYFLKF